MFFLTAHVVYWFVPCDELFFYQIAKFFGNKTNTCKRQRYNMFNHSEDCSLVSQSTGKRST